MSAWGSGGWHVRLCAVSYWLRAPQEEGHKFSGIFGFPPEKAKLMQPFQEEQQVLAVGWESTLAAGTCTGAVTLSTCRPRTTLEGGQAGNLEVPSLGILKHHSFSWGIATGSQWFMCIFQKKFEGKQNWKVSLIRCKKLKSIPTTDTQKVPWKYILFLKVHGFQTFLHQKAPLS